MASPRCLPRLSSSQARNPPPAKCHKSRTNSHNPTYTSPRLSSSATGLHSERRSGPQRSQSFQITTPVLGTRKGHRSSISHETVSPKLASVHEPRQPPTDPRKARRYCTIDLIPNHGYTSHMMEGLRLNLDIPPGAYDACSVASTGSTPLATYATTDSDTSSLCHDVELEFPQPPPISPALSPAMGGLHGSPLFTDAETIAVRDFLRRRWISESAKNSPPVHGTRIHPGLAGCSADQEGEDTDYSLEAESPSLSPTFVSTGPERSGLPNSKKQLSRRSLPHPSSAPMRGLGYNLALAGDHDADAEARKAATLRMFASSSTKSLQAPARPQKSASAPTNQPLVIRKVASMAATSQRHLTDASRSNPDASAPLRFPPEYYLALNRFDAGLEKFKAHNPATEGCPTKPNPGNYNRTSVQDSRTITTAAPPVNDTHTRRSFVPSLALAGRKKPTHRPNVSVPYAGPSSPGPPVTTSPRSLAAPFLHRSSRSQPMAMLPPHNHIVHAPPHTDAPGLKSFMNMTPERERRESLTSGHAQKVRKLLVRASVSVVDWGKSLSKKGNLKRENS